MTWLDAYVRWRADFERVLDPALYTIAWLDKQVADGKATFFCTGNAAIVTEFRHYPTGAKDIHGLIAAGDAKEIADILVPRAEEFAKTQGCVGAIIESRAAWQKVLKGKGYAPYQTSIRKVL